MQIKCVECGKMFEFTRSKRGGNMAITCSDACRRVRIQRQNRKYKQAHKHIKPVHIPGKYRCQNIITDPNTGRKHRCNHVTSNNGTNRYYCQRCWERLTNSVAGDEFIYDQTSSEDLDIDDIGIIELCQGIGENI